jgi:saccharopine dehydrogenase (NAD+, L-lysine-forming)
MDQLNIKFTEKVLGPHLWLRSETKPGEERVAVTPADVKKLLQAGFRISVEKSPHRCFPDDDYKAVGATLVETGSWTRAPSSAIIVGLKELPESKESLTHRHIYFAHCYKNQTGWKDILARFQQGGGLLWDLEFLVDDQGRRVAAFGRAAGVVGMGLAILQWALQRTPGSQPLKNLKSWKTTQDMVKSVKEALNKATEKKHEPRALVLGALGRCGGGAAWFAEQVGISVTRWDLAETKSGGPFPELLTHDILVNAIYLREKIPPFLTSEFIQGFKDRKLSIFSDVSCDYTNPNNPFPIYNEGTTLVDPILHLIKKSESTLPLDVISIDHLPSLTPSDSSSDFSADLIPHLQLLHTPGGHKAPVWTRAEKIFNEKQLEASGQSASKL